MSNCITKDTAFDLNRAAAMNELRAVIDANPERFPGFDFITDLNIDPTRLFDTNEVIKVTSDLNRIYLSKKFKLLIARDPSVTSSSIITTSISETIPSSNFQTIRNRIEQFSLIPQEVANFMIDNGLNPTILSNKINSDLQNIDDISIPFSSNFISVTNDLDIFFNKNFAQSISGGLCSAFGNIFAKIGTLSAFLLSSANIEKLMDLKNKISNFLLNPLESIKDKIFEIIDKLANKLVRNAFDIKNRIIEQLQDISALPSMLIHKTIKKFDDIKRFLEDFNIQKIKDFIEEKIVKMVDQFKNLNSNPDILLLLMFKICQITDIVSDFLQGPVNAFLSFQKSISAKTLSLVGSFNFDNVMDRVHGIKNITRERSKEVKKIAYDKLKGKTPSTISNTEIPTTTIKPITPPLTNEDITAANDWTVVRGSNGRFTKVETQWYELTDSARNVGIDFPFHNDEDGWQMVDLTVWAKAKQLSEALGKKLLITSAYRSPAKNRSVGGASRSRHMSGEALDIFTDGINRIEFIKHASLIGFGGIGVYSTFIHVDISNRRIWGPNGSTSSISSLAPNERDALLIHQDPNRHFG